MTLELIAAALGLSAVVAVVRSQRKVRFAQRLQTVTLSSIGDAVITTDTSGVITFINPEAERLTGWSRADALNRPLRDVFHALREGSRSPVEDPVAAAVRTGEHHPFTNHTILIARDGCERPIESKASPIRHGDGAMEGVVLVFRDCEQRRRAEEALKERVLLQDHLAKIAETAPGVIYAYRVRPDGSSCFPFASRHIQDVYGVSREELVRDAEQAFAMIHAEDRARVIASINESAAALSEWCAEFRVNHPTKGLIWVEGRSMPERESDGSVLWRGFLIDVTQRKNAEVALQESEERFRQITENIKEVFWLTDPETREVMYVSPAFESIWGRCSAELHTSPKVWADAVHPEDRAGVLAALAAKKRGELYDEQYRIVRPDGSIRWIHDRGFPVRDASGTVIRIAAVAEDVTDRHQLESELRQAQKMESVGLLAGGVAHDFNNALTVIMGATEVLSECVPKQGDAPVMLEDIRKATERAAALTRQLLSFSRKDVVAPRVVDFNGLVTETQRMLKRLLREDIDLVSVLAPDLPHVKVDPGQWGQVIVNLAVNARDAMPHGGRLTVETCNAVITASDDQKAGAPKPGHYVKLSVTDTGVGMSPDVVAKIFEPFFTTKGVGEGTGLGLAVVFGIVAQSAGYIDVRSEEGKGTTFDLLIPAADATIEHPTGPVVQAQGVAKSSGVVLLVDDEPHLLQLADRILTSKGYTVISAGSAEDALRVVAERQCGIDLLLTDVVMPAMDGRELADRVRERCGGIPVLFTSGYTEDAVVRDGVQTANAGFIQKPYSPSALVRKVHDAINRVFVVF